MFEVHAIVRLFPRQLETRCLEALPQGETVAQLCRRAFPDFNATRYAMDGGQVSGDQLAAGKKVYCWNVPEAAAAAAVVPMLIAGFAISMAMTALLKLPDYFKKNRRPKYEKQTADLSDEQYGWDYNSRNAEAEGAPIPILYGRRMVIPPIVQQHSYSRNNTLEGFAELVYAVADSGGGFGDKITYPPDDDNQVQALLDHTSWRNYNSDSIESVAPIANRIDGDNIFANATVSGTTVTGVQTADSYSTTALADGAKDTNAAVSAAAGFGARVDISNFVFKATRCIPTSCVVYSRFYKGSYRGVAGFTLSGWNGTSWVTLGSTSSYTGDGYMTTTINLRAGTNYYTIYRIGSFSWRKKEQGGSVGVKCVTEIELYGKTSSDETIPGGFCALDVTNGTLDQVPSSLTSNTYASLNVQKKLDTNYFSFASTPGAKPDILAVHLEFPYGLYNYASGSYGAETVVIACTYRAIATDGTEGSWNNYFTSAEHGTSEITVSGANATITMESQQDLKLTFEKTSLAAITGKEVSHYEVRMKFASAPTAGSTRENTCVWAGLDEGWNFICAYPRTATATLKLLASETLSGQVPQFKILAERATLNIYNPTSGEWEEKAASNPAWAAWDLICRPIFDDSDEDSENATTANSTGVLMREQFPHRKLIYSEFQSWADFCDSEGITCSMYFDSTSTVEKALDYLCDIGRAQLVNRGGAIGVTYDHRIDVCAYAFGDINIVKDSWSVSYLDKSTLPTEVEVTFFDRRREWNRFTVVERDPLADEGDVFQNTESVTLYACDDRAVAQAHAKYLLGRNKVRRIFKWTGDLDSMPCDIGDVVWVYGDRVRITSATYDAEHRRVFEGEEYVTERFAEPPAVVKFTFTVNEATDVYVCMFASRLPVKIDFGDGSDAQEYAATMGENDIFDIENMDDTSVSIQREYESGTYTVTIYAHHLAWFRLNTVFVEGVGYLDSIDRLELNDVENAYRMFADLNGFMGSLHALSIPPGFAPCKAQYVVNMFNNANILRLSDGFRCPKAIDASGMFLASAIQKLPEGFCLPNATDVTGIFANCAQLSSIMRPDAWWDNPVHASFAAAFFNCASIPNYADIPQNWK